MAFNDDDCKKCKYISCCIITRNDYTYIFTVLYTISEKWWCELASHLWDKRHCCSRSYFISDRDLLSVEQHWIMKVNYYYPWVWPFEFKSSGSCGCGDHPGCSSNRSVVTSCYILCSRSIQCCQVCIASSGTFKYAWYQSCTFGSIGITLFMF